VRVLDAEHVARVDAERERFLAGWRPGERPSVARQRRAVAELLAGSQALCIAGGHVGVLVELLRLFDVLSPALELPVVAWAGGAMVLAEKIVLFHDSPPATRASSRTSSCPRSSRGFRCWRSPRPGA